MSAAWLLLPLPAPARAAGTAVVQPAPGCASLRPVLPTPGTGPAGAKRMRLVQKISYNSDGEEVTREWQALR